MNKLKQKNNTIQSIKYILFGVVLPISIVIYAIIS
jgi:hypothetical protein